MERNRFVGFAFAAADLLVETDVDGRIRFASGARCQLVDGAIEKLVGQSLFDLAAPAEREYCRRLFDRTIRKNRIRPSWVTMRSVHGSEFPVLLGACRIPMNPKSVFLSILVATPSKADEEVAGAGRLLSPMTFIQNVEAHLRQAQRSGIDQQLTLLLVEGLGGAIGALSQQDGDNLQRGLDAYLKSVSSDGRGVARLADNRFGVIHGSDVSTSEIQSDVAHILEAGGASSAAAGVRSWTVDMSASTLSPADAARALVYTIQSFAEGMDGGFKGGNLEENARQLLAETMERIARLRRTIEAKDFHIVYQPIVSLHDRRLHHLEALTRFEAFKSPAEFIIFAEKAGLIYDFDLLFCRRVLETLQKFRNTPGVPDVAVNVSAKTLQNPLFLSQFRAMTGAFGDLARKILVEVTETVNVIDFARMEEVVQSLRDSGFRVCLDDVGAGTTSFQTLYRLQVDYAKIDGQFVRQALANDRDRTMLGVLVDTCRQLGMPAVGEQVEDEEQARLLGELGVAYGQGYLFGRPNRHFEEFIGMPASAEVCAVA